MMTVYAAMRNNEVMYLFEKVSDAFACVEDAVIKQEEELKTDISNGWSGSYRLKTEDRRFMVEDPDDSDGGYCIKFWVKSMDILKKYGKA